MYSPGFGRTRILSSLLLLGYLTGCGDSNTAVTDTEPVIDPVISARIDRLEAAIERAEDVSAIKRLQKAYGYYLDKGMWTDLAEFFHDDAVANYPAGVFNGKESIREHLYRNVGSVAMGEVGLGDNRLYNHMNIQPVVHLNPEGGTAEGRWRAMAMFGRYGAGPGVWAEGVYNMVYIKDGDTWKIRNLDYNAGYANTYTEGWGANPDAPPRERNVTLPHPPDEERNMSCEGFPEPCIAPFHYDNPGTSDDSNVWQVPESIAASGRTDYETRLGDLLHRARRLRDELEIENLQRIYGYYYERRMWDHVADLFTENGTIEMDQRGVYTGRERVREFLNLLGEQGLEDGQLFDQLQLQTIATVSPDGQTAGARSREWSMIGEYQVDGSGLWRQGLYENTFVKEDGQWKIRSLHFYPTYITDYDQGWTVDARPAPGVSDTLPPDQPPSETYEIFPKAHVPAFHYNNPVTGNPPVYPDTGGPSQASIAATSMPEAAFYPEPVTMTDLEAALEEAETLVQRVKDHHEIENLENAYGYYLDKNLWNDLADLFAESGSMELAQRGVYIGRERVRQFLLGVFGDEGPAPGRLGNHIHMQPVIHIDEDGDSGKVRSRMMQQLSFGDRPSMGAAIYENELVREDGKWKFQATHAFNTWTAGYDGGWVRNPGNRVPGPSESFPPDTPPSFEFAMFPTVYDIPFHYANPVSGKP